MHTLAAHTRWTYTTRVRCAQSDIDLGMHTGTASCEIGSGGGLTLSERGVWQSTTPGLPAPGTKATNRWRATPREKPGSRWRIEHLRLGTPVHLLDLEPAGPGRWASVTPHPCAEDTYELDADTTDPDRPTLVWTVRGPAKAHLLTTVYRPG
ncbi:MAG: DUF6314 family protein [Phycisphaerales bacterium JB040]